MVEVISMEDGVVHYSVEFHSDGLYSFEQFLTHGCTLLRRPMEETPSPFHSGSRACIMHHMVKHERWGRNLTRF